MQKAIAVVTSSLVLGVLIVFGCSAPSPDGSDLAGGKNGGKSSSSSGSSGDASQATSSSGTSGTSGTVNGNCSNHEKVDDRPACDQCVRAKCCDEVLACDKTADCKAVGKCFDDCKGDLFCQLTCQDTHATGFNVLQGVGNCATASCPNECPSQTPDGGVDPFGDF